MIMLQFITHTNDFFDYTASAMLALEGGCRWIQLRMKEASTEVIRETARRLLPVCRRYGATLILDDRADLVRETGADGVHLGKNDMPVKEARRLLGPEYIIGGTANSFDDVQRLAADGVDYIGLGPFRFTTTKKNLSPVLGLEGYRDILARCREEGIAIPVVAIGGITRNDIPDLLATGIRGIALSGTILNADRPVEEARLILNLFKEFSI
ncbi:MAG: thiamine phosphate synthase [Coprobacter sp.]|nr:thiamine phosphate synthase [Coprobacter sp.]